MQSAIYETHAIYVSADVHDGWNRVQENSANRSRTRLIGPPHKPIDVGGHAFALVGYTADGFIVQNSWGPTWGYHGFAYCLTKTGSRYGTDAWTLALGAPMAVVLISPAIKGERPGPRLEAPSAFRSPEMRTDISLDERLRARSTAA